MMREMIVCGYQLRDGSIKRFWEIFCENCPGYKKEYKENIVGMWSMTMEEYNKKIEPTLKKRYL